MNIDSLYQSSIKQFPGQQSTLITNKPLTVETIQEHWGTIWGCFENTLDRYIKQDVLKKTHWKAPRSFPPNYKEEFRNLFLITICSYPDVIGKQIQMEYCEQSENIINLNSRLKGYGMNQYFKSVPLKNSIHRERQQEFRLQTTHVPTYYIYEIDTVEKNGVEFDMAVFSLQVPFMIRTHTNYPVIDVHLGMYLPKGYINCKMFIENLYDYLNKIMFFYQLTHFAKGSDESSKELIENLHKFIEHLNEYIDNVIFPFKPNYEVVKDGRNTIQKSQYLSAIISGHLQSYYTICVLDSIQMLNSISFVLKQFNNPSDLHSYSHNISEINPFFTLQFVDEFDTNLCFEFPYPVCVVDTTKYTVEILKEYDSIKYFMLRSQYFLGLMYKQLKLNVPNNINAISKSFYQLIIVH